MHAQRVNILPVSDTHVAANIRAEMARQRKTQTEMAPAIGISRMALHRRLTGKAAFKASELAAAAKFLAVPITDLLGDLAA